MTWQTATVLNNVSVFSSYNGNGLFLGDRGTGNCIVNLGKEGDEVIVGVNAWIEKSVIKREKKLQCMGKQERSRKVEVVNSESWGRKVRPKQSGTKAGGFSVEPLEGDGVLI